MSFSSTSSRPAEAVSSPSPSGLLVVGAGAMASAYADALRILGRLGETRVHGRGRRRAEALGAVTGVPATWGGTAMLAELAPPTAAIVAVDHVELPAVTVALARAGCRLLLVEKPGALSAAELEQVEREVESAGASVYVAYNRRFYPSVDAARRVIAEDGGVLACSFEFTEIEQRTLAAEPDVHALERWGVVNSLHVIDLAVHLAGEPEELSPYRAGSLPWHPAGAVYAGAGRTVTRALLTYVATWSGAGSWGLELTTPRRRLELRPLEQLKTRGTGAFVSEPVTLEPEPEGTKPGLVAQTRAFLDATSGAAPDPRLCPLSEAVSRLRLAERILGY